MTGDNEILTALQENPEKGFRLLMANYREPIYWHIRRLVVTHADAQDATQETFVRVFRGFSQYDEGYSFKAWLFRIATNEALRQLSRFRGHEISLDEATADMLDLKADAYYNSGDEVAARLQQAILHLPAKQQLAFNLRYYDDMAYEEIAQVAETTVSTVKVNYHLAKEKIIKYMETND
jgi:RNA polymerase sigma-70 factor (ECF subfamily)